MPVLRVPAIRGLTDRPEHAAPGLAGDCLNIDLSEATGRGRDGSVFHGAAANRLTQIGSSTDNYLAGLWHFRSRSGVLHEIRAVCQDDGAYLAETRYGLVGAAVATFQPASADMDHTRMWSGVEFAGQFVMATHYDAGNDNTTLALFDPNTHWQRITAEDRTTNPLHGSLILHGIDGDDQGPYLEQAPKGTLLAVHSDRLFTAGLPDEHDSFRYSNLSDPSGWPANNVVRIATRDGEGIKAMAPLGRNLVFFKRRSIHVATFLSQYDAQVRDVVQGVGCVHHASVANTGGLLVFLGEEDVHAFDGAQTINLSDPVDKTKSNIAKRLKALRGRFDQAVGRYYRSRHQYWLSLPAGGVRDGLAGEVLFILDMQTGEWSEYQFSAANFGVRAMSTVLNEDGREMLVLGGHFETTTGGSNVTAAWFLRADFGDVDAGIDGDVNLTRRWESAQLVLGEHRPMRFKSVRPVFGQTFEGDVRVYWRLDHETRTAAEGFDQFADIDALGDYDPKRASLFGEATWSRSRWSDVDPHSDRLHMRGAVGKVIRVGFETTGVHAFDLRSLQVDAESAGSW